MKINWQIRCEVKPDLLSLMQQVADRSLFCEGVKLPCSVSVTLCDDETIALINETWRNIARPTDVLSFPSVTWPKGKTAGHCENLLRREYDDEDEACFLGDLVISVPHLLSQANEYGHTPQREGAYLLAHGLCHLMGYDHLKKDEKKEMRVMEEKILGSLGLDREGETKVADEVLLQLAREAMTFSYSPYSSFPVGAALHSTDGRIFTGCNVENASLSLTNCAERTALFKAVSEGARSFDVIAIAANGKAWPCGACRQALGEFAPDLRVLVTWEDHIEERTLRELLPENFGPGSF